MTKPLLSDLPGARFIQPPSPAGYWTAPCDDGCAQGGKTKFDMHGSYEVLCGKCIDGWMTEETIARWERKREGPDYL